MCYVLWPCDDDDDDDETLYPVDELELHPPLSLSLLFPIYSIHKRVFTLLLFAFVCPSVRRGPS